MENTLKIPAYAKKIILDLIEANIEWQVHFVDYRSTGDQMMGGWVGGSIKINNDKPLAARKDWAVPYREDFDMSENESEAKKEIIQLIYKFILGVDGEKND